MIFSVVFLVKMWTESDKSAGAGKPKSRLKSADLFRKFCETSTIHGTFFWSESSSLIGKLFWVVVVVVGLVGSVWIIDNQFKARFFLSFLPKFPTASSCFFTRSGMNFFAQKMNFTVFYLVRKWIYPKKQWNFQKTGKFIFWKMNFTVFSGKFIFWLNKNG